MNKTIGSIFVLLAMSFASTAAFAASLTVTVKQTGSNTPAQTVTCELLKPGCVLPFVINAGQPSEQSLNVNVVYYTNGLALNFQSPNGYFYTDAVIGTAVIYHALWNRPLQGSTPVTYSVTLFQPLAMSSGPESISTAAHTPAANLEITATAVP